MAWRCWGFAGLVLSHLLEAWRLFWDGVYSAGVCGRHNAHQRTAHRSQGRQSLVRLPVMEPHPPVLLINDPSIRVPSLMNSKLSS